MKNWRPIDRSWVSPEENWTARIEYPADFIPPNVSILTLDIRMPNVEYPANFTLLVTRQAPLRDLTHIVMSYHSH